MSLFCATKNKAEYVLTQDMYHGSVQILVSCRVASLLELRCPAACSWFSEVLLHRTAFMRRYSTFAVAHIPLPRIILCDSRPILMPGHPCRLGRARSTYGIVTWIVMEVHLSFSIVRGYCSYLVRARFVGDSTPVCSHSYCKLTLPMLFSFSRQDMNTFMLP